MTPKRPGTGIGGSVRRRADPFVEHCIELLAPLGPVRARAMFGGHGLYLDDLFFALIAGERLYLKTDARTERHFGAAGGEPFVYEAQGKTQRMGYWTVPADAMESSMSMQPWARLAVQTALQARAARIAGRLGKAPKLRAAR